MIAISTSGKSKNIIEALKVAKQKGILTILFTGEKVFKKTVILCLTHLQKELIEYRNYIF